MRSGGEAVVGVLWVLWQEEFEREKSELFGRLHSLRDSSAVLSQTVGKHGADALATGFTEA